MANNAAPACQDCSNPCISKQSNSANNPGRLFWSCSPNCKGFQGWCDEEPRQSGGSRGRSYGSSHGTRQSNLSLQTGGMGQRGGYGQQQRGRGMGAGQRGGYGQQRGGSGGSNASPGFQFSHPTKPGGSFTPSPWEKPYVTATPGYAQPDDICDDGGMDIDVQQQSNAAAAAHDTTAPGAGANAATDAALQWFQQLSDALTDLRSVCTREFEHNKVSKASQNAYDTKVLNQIENIVAQLRDVIDIQKKQQDHLDAMTRWIQEHVEAQDAKKKATPAKK